MVDWDSSPAHLAPELHPSPLGGDTYLFELLPLQIKRLAQMRVKTSTAQKRIKISAPQETQRVQYQAYSRGLLKKHEIQTPFFSPDSVSIYSQRLSGQTANLGPSKKSTGLQTLAPALLGLAAVLDVPCACPSPTPVLHMLQRACHDLVLLSTQQPEGS